MLFRTLGCAVAVIHFCLRRFVAFILPLQLFPLTYVGLPPELLRMQHGSDASKQRVPDEVPVRVRKGWAGRNII